MWALHNSLKGWTLYGLSEREAQLVVNTLTVNEAKLVKVCKLPEKKWHKLDREKCPELFVSLNKERGQFPELSSDDMNTEYTDTDYFVVKAKPQFYPRLHERIDLKTQAVILGQSQNFSTTTINLSEGGIQFSEVIPSWVSGYFIVKITYEDTIHKTADHYSVMCSLVEDQSEKIRVQIMSEESDPQFIRYKEWLENLRSQKY